MIIPPYIKRRAIQIDDYLTMRLTLFPQYFTEHHVEGYLNRITRDVSEWFIQTVAFRYGMPADYYKKVNEITPFIKYLIRTKVVLHWEKMNNKVIDLEIK